MIPAARKKSSREAAGQRERVDQEAGHDKEDRYEQRIAHEFQLALGRLVFHRRIDRQAGQERADDARQVDELREQRRHGENAEHQDEIGLLVVLHLPQHVGPSTAQPEQDERDEHDDFDDLDGEPRSRKAAGVQRHANGEHEQRQGVRHHRGADGHDDGFERFTPKLCARWSIRAACATRAAIPRRWPAAARNRARGPPACPAATGTKS